MVKRFCSVALSALVFASCGTKAVAPVQQTLANKADSVAYAFGVANGESFKKMLGNLPGDSLSRKKILEGFSASLTGENQLMNAEAARNYFQNYIKEIQEKEDRERLAKNDSVLAVNKNRPGVKTTESGLQYRVLKEGTGAKPSEQDTVTVHYVGKLIDGTTFDSSYERKEPATFPLNQVIPGWTEGVALMQTGAKYEFYIPSKLGYGERGAGSAIPANATLIFEVELLAVKPFVAEKESTTTEATAVPTNKAPKQTKMKRKGNRK